MSEKVLKGLEFCWTPGSLGSRDSTAPSATLKTADAVFLIILANVDSFGKHLLFCFQHCHESGLRDGNFTNLLHFFLPFLLFFPEFTLSGDVSTVTLGGYIL